MRTIDDISVPTLLVEGTLDHQDIHRRNLFLRDAIQNVLVVEVDDAGHNPPLENPEAFIKAVLPALESACAAF